MSIYPGLLEQISAANTSANRRIKAELNKYIAMNPRRVPTPVQVREYLVGLLRSEYNFDASSMVSYYAFADIWLAARRGSR
jgi:hypothetical protein